MKWQERKREKREEKMSTSTCAERVVQAEEKISLFLNESFFFINLYKNNQKKKIFIYNFTGN